MANDYVGILVLSTTAFIGVWAVVNPVELLQWLKSVRPDLRDNPEFRPNDARSQSLVRFIGWSFISISILIFVASVFAQYR